MKTFRIVMMGIAGLLVITMITLMILTQQQMKKNVGPYADYESANIDDLPEDIVDESLDVDAGLEVGEVAPDFELKTLEGDTVKLSDYRGQMVMINFWASWCPPCRVEMPHMETYYQNSKEKDNIEILAVNMSTLERGDLEKIPNFVEERGLTFPILLDEKGHVKDLYKVLVYPTTYIVNPEGIITDRIVIPLDVEVIEWLVENSIDFDVESIQKDENTK